MKVLDQTGDLNGQRLYRIVNLCGQPDHVKSASSEQIYGNKSDLPLQCFALPGSRQFPLHHKAACWTSYAFLLDSAPELTAEDFQMASRHLKQAAELHGILPEFEQLERDFAKTSAGPAATDEDFALVVKLATGETERHYPLRNASEVKAAASYLLQHRDEIPYVNRRQMAERILEKAAEFGADIHTQLEYLEKQAGLGWCAASDAARLLEQRATVLGRLHVDLSSELEKSAQLCAQHPAKTRSMDRLVKLAELLDDIDREYGLAKYYGAGLDRPDDVLFGVTIKTASAFLDGHCATTSGSIYKVADLGRLSIDELRNAFGDELADAVSDGGLLLSPEKMAEQARALPRPDAELLDQLLSAVGVRPMAKEAAHQDGWMTEEALRELAVL